MLQAGDKQAIPRAAADALAAVGAAEECMVKGFPFEVPAEYADLPQLKVRGGGIVWQGLPLACGG